MTNNRVPSGVPTGGQFASTPRNEADVTLPVPSDDGLDFARETLGSDASDTEVRQLADERVDRDRREAVAQAEEAIGDYESGLRHGFDDFGQQKMLTAASRLVPHVATHQQASLRSAQDALEVAIQNGSLSRQGEMRVLHAELVDATSDTPTRSDLAHLREVLTRASGDVDDAQVDFEMGRGSETTVAAAKEVEAGAVSALHRAQDERRDGRLMRVAQRRPTVYDMWESQDLCNTWRLKRRSAVTTADAVRSAYVSTSHDSPDIDRLRLNVDEMTRREGEAEEAYARAKRELDDVNRAWGQQRGFRK